MLHSLYLQAPSSYPRHKILKPGKLSRSLNPPFYIKFPTKNIENVRYLTAIGVLDANTTKLHKLPHPDAITQIINTINFLKSKGFQDSDMSELASGCPQIFSDVFEISEIEPVFEFLHTDLLASVQESRGLIINCPELLCSDVEHCLRPTLDYLRRLKVGKLNVPSKLNAKILNTRVPKLHSKVKFLKSIGLSHQEAASFCARIPAIFGYSIEYNLRPKVDFLFKGMERSLEELIEFPQYFGFSLRKRIVPRHLHLKQRNVRIKLNRMLMWSDERFFAKWK